jgi:hypothetical protein
MRSRSSWQSSDAWVLVAIEFGGGDGKPRSLDHVINAADYINRLILTEEELAGAIARLSAAGLIVLSARGLALTPAGRRLAGRKGRERVLDRIDRVRSELARLPHPDLSSGQRLPAGAYDKAIAANDAWWAAHRTPDPTPGELLGYAAQYLGWYVEAASGSEREPERWWLESAGECVRRAHDALASSLDAAR